MEHGIVDSVYYEDGVVYCDITPIRKSSPYRDIPLMKPHSGLIAIPKPEDKVAIDSLNDGTRFVQSVISKNQPTPSGLHPGDISLYFDDNTKLEFKINNDDTYNVELSSSGDLNIGATGDITLDSGGEVIINGIPFGSHQHPYSDSTISDTSDGSGTETTSSKSTGNPE